MDLFKSRFMIPKIFQPSFSKLSLKISKEGEELNMKYSSYFTNSGNYTDPDEPLALQISFSTLSKPVFFFFINTIVMLLRCVKNSYNTLKKLYFLIVYGERNRLSHHFQLSRKLIVLLDCHHGLMNQNLQLERPPPKRQWVITWKNWLLLNALHQRKKES